MEESYKERIQEMYETLEDHEDKTPSDIVLICRNILEGAIDLIFESEKVRKPVGASLLELINNETIQSFFESDVFIDAMHFVRIVGINAHHNKHTKKTQAQVAYDNTKLLLDYISQKLEGSPAGTLPCETVLEETAPVILEDTPEKKLYTKMNEANTRKVYIDLYLNEAGWEVVEPKSFTKLANGQKVASGDLIPGKACAEIPVSGLKNASGVGFCDYVLYDSNGKPLAIVEAKKTSEDAHKGSHQVKEYGDCIKAQYGYVPILYYTNGYDIYINDGIYPDRKVAAFHTRDELAYMLQKRTNTKINDMIVNSNIAGRPYQTMAIRSICERFNQMYRRALLVMATGTGKTRTAIALVDLLTRHNYVKNVLFLADRTSLVRQAFKNFQKLLPNMTYSVISDPSLANDPDARISFSTHQTMINYIDSEDKKFSVGRFDLIIIDEAHRSIFNKYGAIFSYFDSLLVGLTATPKDEVDANTYSLFGCESGVPNFSYAMKEAVNDKYLVPYVLENRTSKRLEGGIEYDKLSEEDKESVNRLSDAQYDDGSVITGNELFRKVFNKDTCRRVLEDVMEDGLKIEGGQLLGKTIIFAVNHFHAQMIVDTFYEMYPMYTGYCKLIDNQIKNSDHLIEEFETDPTFRIAVSVDMLDTGIDVPSVLNLVFFKRVNSNIKLIQMIGRGTRTCEGLIDGKDKSCFKIFDYFNNLKDENFDSIKQPISISQKIFAVRLRMLCEMQTHDHQVDPEHRSYYLELRDQLVKDVKNIKDNGSERLAVRAAMGTVDKFYDEKQWQYLSELDEMEILHTLMPLVVPDIKESYVVLSFDYKMMLIEEKLIRENDISGVSNIVKQIRKIAQALRLKASIDDILNKMNEIDELYGEAMWMNPSLTVLEEKRKNLRNLMKYLVEAKIVAVGIDSSDETMDGEIIDIPTIDIRTYKEKILDYLMENSDNPTIRKIKNLEPLTSEDFDALQDILWVKLGTKDDYYSISKLDNIAAFVRSLVGIEQEAVNKKLSEYLSNNDLSSEQMEFIYSIINYARENGDITKLTVVSEEPFKGYNLVDLFGGNAGVIAKVVDTLHDCIERA